jgi:hypothetical protein
LKGITAMDYQHNQQTNEKVVEHGDRIAHLSKNIFPIPLKKPDAIFILQQLPSNHNKIFEHIKI